MKITSEATVLGQTARVTVEITGEGELTSDAQDRIAYVMRREAQRFAEIAGVDVRDQPIRAEEEKRIREAPADRPAIVIAAGTKDPKQVAVTRGTWEIGGRKLSAAKG